MTPYFRSADPELDALRYNSWESEQESKLPKCSCCGEPILQEDAVYIDDWICDECLKTSRRLIEYDE